MFILYENDRNLKLNKLKAQYNHTCDYELYSRLLFFFRGKQLLRNNTVTTVVNQYKVDTNLLNRINTVNKRLIWREAVFTQQDNYNGYKLMLP